MLNNRMHICPRQREDEQKKIESSKKTSNAEFPRSIKVNTSKQLPLIINQLPVCRSNNPVDHRNNVRSVHQITPVPPRASAAQSRSSSPGASRYSLLFFSFLPSHTTTTTTAEIDRRRNPADFHCFPISRTLNFGKERIKKKERTNASRANYVVNPLDFHEHR